MNEDMLLLYFSCKFILSLLCVFQLKIVYQIYYICFLNMISRIPFLLIAFNPEKRIFSILLVFFIVENLHILSILACVVMFLILYYRVSFLLNFQVLRFATFIKNLLRAQFAFKAATKFSKFLPNT